METCSDVSTCATAGTTSSTSSCMNPPAPALPSARCVLRYAVLLPYANSAYRKTQRVGEQVSLRIIQQGTHQRSDLPRGVVRTGSDNWHVYSPEGSGDFCKYAATPITALISAAAIPMRNVAPIPACRLKCCGSMPTAAKPVSTPPAAPLIAAASRPFSHSSIRVIITLDSADRSEYNS